MNEDRFFITGITKENEQTIIDKLERSGFTNYWKLPEPTADGIYVSTTLDNQYIKTWDGDYKPGDVLIITAEDYLCEEVSK